MAFGLTITKLFSSGVAQVPIARAFVVEGVPVPAGSYPLNDLAGKRAGEQRIRICSEICLVEGSDSGGPSEAGASIKSESLSVESVAEQMRGYPEFQTDKF